MFTVFERIAKNSRADTDNRNICKLCILLNFACNFSSKSGNTSCSSENSAKYKVGAPGLSAQPPLRNPRSVPVCFSPTQFLNHPLDFYSGLQAVIYLGLWGNLMILSRNCFRQMIPAVHIAIDRCNCQRSLFGQSMMC